MSDYSNTFGGAAHDTAEDVIYGADFDTQFDAVSTMSATKANKKTPATTNSLATLDSGGDLGDSLETVATMKSYAKRGAIYLDAAATSSTISFSGTTISRTAGTIDLSVFKKGDVITITGTTLNNTSYTLASDGAAASMQTTVSTTTESGQEPVFTTEGVVEVLDEDDMATDSASSVPSQQSTKAYVTTMIPTVFTSSEFTLSSTSQSEAHGIGAVPDTIQLFGICKTAQGNYVADDIVAFNPSISDFDESSGSSTSGFQCSCDDTNVYVRTNGIPYIYDKLSGGLSLTLASWRLIVKAIKYQ